MLVVARASAARAEPLPKLAAVVPKLHARFDEPVRKVDLPGLGVGIVLDGELGYGKDFR